MELIHLYRYFRKRCGMGRMRALSRALHAWL